MTKRKKSKSVETLTHGEAARRNIPTAEYHPVMAEEDKAPIRVAYERRNRDLDPQLVWRGKDEQDAADLVVQAPPLYIQEKVHPKVLIDDLLRQTKARREEEAPAPPDLFADFNGLPDGAATTEFYRHDANWSNRMILGDSLQVMASLAEREGLRGKVQCIYIDPPYGIRFNSNFQWSTTSRDVKDGKAAHITREPEQVKAFRDTWRDGIHSYLSYLRDRLTVARDLLTESGSVFVQIGDENVHRVRALMDEVFGEENHVANVVFRKTTGKAGISLDNTYDVVIWFARKMEKSKARELFFRRHVELDQNFRFDFTESGALSPATDDPYRIARMNPITSQSSSTTTLFEFDYCGKVFRPGKGGWKTSFTGMERLGKASRLTYSGRTLGFVRPFEDYPYQTYNDIWDDTRQSGFGDEKVYVVQTGTRVIQRCILMTTDPGDLVLDPTCGSGTTAYVAEQWGRRWITVDTSRVALALARARIMGARYPWYLLADSPEGQRKEGEIAQRAPSEAPTGGDIRQGFVYERVPPHHPEIHRQQCRDQRDLGDVAGDPGAAPRPAQRRPRRDVGGVGNPARGRRGLARRRHDGTRGMVGGAHRPPEGRSTPPSPPRRTTSISTTGPIVDNARIRVAGPFTVESLAPHRMLAVDENDELLFRPRRQENSATARPKISPR